MAGSNGQHEFPGTIIVPAIDPRREDDSIPAETEHLPDIPATRIVPPRASGDGLPLPAAPPTEIERESYTKDEQAAPKALLAENESLMEAAWQQFLSAYRHRDLNLVSKNLDLLLAARDKEGFANTRPYSLALLALAEETNARQDATGTQALTDYALRLSPDFSAFYQSQSSLAFSKKRFFSSLASFFAAIGRLFSNQGQRLQAIALLWFSAAYLPLWLMTFMTLALLLRYIQALRETLERRFNRLTPSLLVCALLAASAMMFFRSILLLPGLFLLFICLFHLMTLKERLAYLLTLVMLFFSPFAYQNGLQTIKSLSSPILRPALQVNFDSYGSKEQHMLAAGSQHNAEQVLALFSQSVAAGNAGDITAAISALEQLIAIDPQPEAAAYNNLANFYFLNNESEKAINTYKKAIACKPASGIYHYNLNHAYMKESFSLAESEASFIHAWELSPKMIQEQLAKERRANDPVLIHEPLPWSYTYRLVTEQLLTTGDKNEFYRLFFAPWGALLLYVAFLVTVGVIIAVLWIKRDKNRAFCPLCGTTFHGIGRAFHACPSCLHIARKADNDSFALQQRKKIRVFTWIADRLMLVCGFLIPGTYQLVLGETIKGFFMLWGGFVLAVVIFLTRHQLVHCGLFPPGSPWGIKVFPLLLVVGLYSINIYSWSKRCRQRQTVSQ